MITTRTYVQLYIVLIVTAVTTLPVSARNHPDKPAMSSSPTPTVTAVSGEEVFNCGTWRDGGRGVFWDYHRNEARKRDIARGAAGAMAAVDFVYDDVWVVEDDGSILLSGTNAFDTPGTSIRYTPNGGGYDVSAESFAFDFVLGSKLSMGDDTESVQPLQFAFSFFGTPWSEIHIGANGIVGLGANPNPAGFYDSNDFWNTAPKIAPYFLDLDPGAPQSNGVYFRSEADSAIITWNAVIEYSQGSRLNTFQLLLRSDGSFDMSHAGLQSTVQLTGGPIAVGIHPGGSPPMSRISLSGDLPFSGGVGTGIYEDYFQLVNPQVNETALFQKFYTQFPDSFFQLIYFTDFAQTMAGFANEQNIENSVTGIGLSIFDNSSVYGSNGVLESRCNMNQLAVWFLDPEQRFANSKNNSFLSVMGQEAGHRWGAFARFVDGGSQVSNLILGRSDAHWSYYIDVDHSSLEGGNWDETAPGYYTCPTRVDFFSAYDEYMMGLRTPEEVAPTFFVSSASNDLPAARSVGTPGIGATAVGTPVTVTIDDIIAAEGARTPLEPDEDKDLRTAFMLVIQNGGTATPAELDQIATYRRAWEPYFEKSCDGRLTVNTRLHQQWPVAVVHGHVFNRLTDEIVDNFTIESSQRGFVQFVPAGGRYVFRYQADESSNVYEAASLEVTAPGYYPRTINIGIPYGAEGDIDIELDPVPSSIDELTRPLPSTLYQNFPNPFNPVTTIPYDVSERAHVRVTVFNARGQLVRTLVDAVESPGHKRVTWDGRDRHGNAVASGVYAFRADIGAFSETRKMVLVK